MTDEGGYAGLVGAIPYAFRASDSRLFRSYVAVGGALALLVGVLFGLALVVAVFRTLGAGGGTFTFSRAFLITVGLLVVLPLLAPVLLVARRHRRRGSDARYDAAMAAAGYLFVLSLYAGLLISTPAAQQETPPALLGPIVSALYALPRVGGLVPPILAAALIVLVHRRLG